MILLTLVSDNLNTHTRGAFYEVFESERARELVRRIEFCHTPKHESFVTKASESNRPLIELVPVQLPLMSATA
jgi:hypothetical protein